MHSITDNIKIEEALPVTVINTAADDTGDVDLLGSELTTIAVMVGNISETLDGTHKIEVKLQHADADEDGTAGAYSNCTDDHVQGITGLTSGVFVNINSNAKESKTHLVNYVGGKRFIKVTLTPTGLTTGGAVGILMLRGNLAQRPAQNF